LYWILSANLKILELGHNLIDDWSGIEALGRLKNLKQLSLTGNPIYGAPLEAAKKNGNAGEKSDSGSDSEDDSDANEETLSPEEKTKLKEAKRLDAKHKQYNFKMKRLFPNLVIRDGHRVLSKKVHGYVAPPKEEKKEKKVAKSEKKGKEKGKEKKGNKDKVKKEDKKRGVEEDAKATGTKRKRDGMASQTPHQEQDTDERPAKIAKPKRERHHKRNESPAVVEESPSRTNKDKHHEKSGTANGMTEDSNDVKPKKDKKKEKKAKTKEEKSKKSKGEREPKVRWVASGSWWDHCTN
jgi:hypothetical protein